MMPFNKFFFSTGAWVLGISIGVLQKIASLLGYYVIGCNKRDEKWTSHNLCKKICYNLLFVEKVVAATTVLSTIDRN